MSERHVTDKGRVAKLEIAIQTITDDRDRLLEVLRETEQRASAFFEKAPVAFALLRLPDRVTVDVNEAFTRLFGLSREEAIGRTINALGIADEESLASIPTENHRAGAVQCFETTRWCSGERRILSIDVVPLIIVGQEHTLITIQDITDQRQSEEALRESEARFRQTVQSSAIVLARTDRELRYRWIHNSHCDFGTAEVIGRTDLDIEDTPATRKLTDLKRRVLESGAGVREEIAFERSDGTRTYDITLEPFKDESGAVQGVFSAALDITPRKRAEEERLERERHRLHAQRLENLGMLAGGIAHDFNNLLHVISAYSSLARKECDARSGAYLEGIESAVQRATSLTAQMLAYAGKGKVTLEAVDVSRLIREMGQLLRSSISKKAELKLELAAALPTVMADASQVNQIILNLIVNASEALGEASGEIRVRTEALELDQRRSRALFPRQPLPEGKYVLLEVSDTGSGMDALTQARIFEPFFSTKFLGRGLGLSAVQGIVRSHRGALRVESRLNVGTTFTVLLPASDAVAESEARKDAGRTRGTAVRSKLAGAVLAVDDEVTLLEVLRFQLESLGLQVFEARDGLEAIEVYRQHRDDIALVVLDYKMPRMDGLETFAALRAINPSVAVILSSGHAEEDAIEAHGNLGWVGFLQKPYDHRQLEETIQRIAGDSASLEHAPLGADASLR